METTFWTLLRDSVIIQGIVTLACVGTIIYLAVTGQPIPELLQTVTTLVIGFWFGSKVEHAISNAVRGQ